MRLLISAAVACLLAAAAALATFAACITELAATSIDLFSRRS